LRFLLDTDACLWILQGREPLLTTLRKTSPEDLAIATISEAELRFTCLNSSDAAAALERIELLLASPIQILPFDRAAAERYPQLRFALTSNPIAERNLIVASSALAHDLTLVTTKADEFEHVPELRFVDVTEDTRRVVIRKTKTAKLTASDESPVDFA
jgi:tRNA(fMet)-specific endonuclease VapC